MNLDINDYCILNIEYIKKIKENPPEDWECLNNRILKIISCVTTQNYPYEVTFIDSDQELFMNCAKFFDEKDVFLCIKGVKYDVWKIQPTAL